jgi:hypothetical protein
MPEINLNDSKYEEKDVLIFNDGEAGIVENVMIDRLEKKPADKQDNHPDWKIYYKSENGGEIGEGVYYPDEKTVQDRIDKLFRNLRHLSNAIVGANHSYPAFPDEKSAIDGILGVIQQNCSGKKFRVMVTYGTTMKPKGFLQIRSYPPFLEPMNVASADTRLKPSKVDVMERIVPDANQGITTGAPTTTDEQGY